MIPNPPENKAVKRDGENAPGQAPHDSKIGRVPVRRRKAGVRKPIPPKNKGSQSE